MFRDKRFGGLFDCVVVEVKIWENLEIEYIIFCLLKIII